VKENLTEDEIKQTKKKSKVAKSNGKFPEIEESLLQWFKEKRNNKLPVTMEMIKSQARSLFEKNKQKYLETKDEKLKHYDNESFSASSGWFKRFKS